MKTFTFGTEPRTTRQRAEARVGELLGQLTRMAPAVAKSASGNDCWPGDWQLMQDEGAVYIDPDSWGDTPEPFRELGKSGVELCYYDTGELNSEGTPLWDFWWDASVFLGRWGKYHVYGYGGGRGCSPQGLATDAPPEVVRELWSRHFRTSHKSPFP